MDVRVELWRRLSTEELILLNYGVGEDSWESLGDPREIQPIHPKGDQSWMFIERTDVEAETPILWPPDAKSWLIGKDPDAGQDWKWEEKGTTEDETGWMASPTRWTWVWASSGSWWWTGKPGVLQFMGLQRAGHDWVSELTETPWLSHDFYDLVFVNCSKPLNIFQSYDENLILEISACSWRFCGIP